MRRMYSPKWLKATNSHLALCQQQLKKYEHALSAPFCDIYAIKVFLHDFICNGKKRHYKYIGQSALCVMPATSKKYEHALSKTSPYWSPHMPLLAIARLFQARKFDDPLLVGHRMFGFGRVAPLRMRAHTRKQYLRVCPP